jgi:hypothetical protein
LLVRAQKADTIRPSIQVDEVMALLGSTCPGTLHGGWNADLRRRTLAIVYAGLRYLSFHGRLGRRTPHRGRPTGNLRGTDRMASQRKAAGLGTPTARFRPHRPRRHRRTPAPDGPIVAARVPGLGAREALLADDPDVYFITPHFANYPAVLVRLALISVADLEELLTEAWLAQAPKRLAATFLASRP